MGRVYSSVSAGTRAASSLSIAVAFQSPDHESIFWNDQVFARGRDSRRGPLVICRSLSQLIGIATPMLGRARAEEAAAVVWAGPFRRWSPDLPTKRWRSPWPYARLPPGRTLHGLVVRLRHQRHDSRGKARRVPPLSASSRTNLADGSWSAGISPKKCLGRSSNSTAWPYGAPRPSTCLPHGAQLLRSKALHRQGDSNAVIVREASARDSRLWPKGAITVTERG